VTVKMFDYLVLSVVCTFWTL